LKSYLSECIASVNSNLSSTCGDLLFSLVKENSKRLIFHFGYGSVAGVLMDHGIDANDNTLPSKLEELSSDEESLLHKQQDWDLVTGQDRKKTTKKEDPFAGMTEEEIEQEGEKLVVLLERLNKNGMIKMK
jgi:hypothetical protein